MNDTLLNIVKKIVEQYGDNVLTEPRRISAFFADLAQNIPKSQKNAFIKCIEHGSTQALKNTIESDRDIFKQQLTQKLHEEEGFDLKLCLETIELLTEVLFTNEQKKDYCSKCGKELKKEWKVCPYCSTSLTSQINKETEEKQSPSEISSGSGSEGYGMEQIKSEIITSTIDNSQQKVKQKKTKNPSRSKLTAAIIIGILGITISILIGVHKYNEMESLFLFTYQQKELTNQQLNTKSQQYDKIKSKYDDLLIDYEKSIGIWIHTIKVGNWNDYWISRPGDTLSAKNMRYLMPVITYSSNDYKSNITLYVKIINPNGLLNYNSSISPRGFSYSYKVNIISGMDIELELSGWGSSNESTYSSGNYTIEIWCNNKRLKSEKVYIGS
jgi:hypothetical protein